MSDPYVKELFHQSIDFSVPNISCSICKHKWFTVGIRVEDLNCPKCDEANKTVVKFIAQ